MQAFRITVPNEIIVFNFIHSQLILHALKDMTLVSPVLPRAIAADKVYALCRYFIHKTLLYRSINNEE